MSNTIDVMPTSRDSGDEARYALEELQPESAVNERNALAEREDGTVRAGAMPIDGVPIIKLTVEEHQPIDAVSEYQAPSEREDGTNIG